MMFRLALPLAFAVALTGCQTTQPIAGSAPVTAAQAAELQEAKLATRVAEFDTAIRANNAKQIINMMPPKVIAHLAKMTEQPVGKFKTAIAAQTRKVMSGATIHTSTMNVAQGAVKSVKGQPYALLPTHTDISVKGQRMQQSTTTVAIEDKGVWYLVRVEDAQTANIVKAAYPALKNIKLH